MPTTNDPQFVFRALADPTRREFISMLAEGSRPIAEIAAQFEMTPARRRQAPCDPA